VHRLRDRSVGLCSIWHQATGFPTRPVFSLFPASSHTPCWTALQCRHSDTNSFSLTLKTHATRGSAGGSVVIFAWRMPTCGWIDFTSNAGFGPPVRRVEMWPLPSSAPQVSVGGPRHVSGWRKMPVFAWVPILDPWWNSWTLWQVTMVSTQANGNVDDPDGSYINKSDGICNGHPLDHPPLSWYQKVLFGGDDQFTDFVQPHQPLTCRSHSEALNQAPEENFTRSTIHFARSSARHPEFQIHRQQTQRSRPITDSTQRTSIRTKHNRCSRELDQVHGPRATRRGSAREQPRRSAPSQPDPMSQPQHPSQKENSPSRKLVFKTNLLYTLGPPKALKASGQQNTHKSHGSEMFSHLWPTSTPSQRSKNTTSLTNNASPGTTHHPNIGREPHLNHTIFKPFKAPFPISQSATSTPNQQHQTSTKQTSFTSLSSPQRPPNPQLGFSEQARTEDINSQVAYHTPPHRSAQPQHQPDGISLSPRSTSAISAGYRGFRDPGNGFRHPGPQEETQRSRTTGRNPGTQNHHKEPATEEPIRRQTRAPAPNFNRISLSPQSTSAIPARYRRFQYHGNGLRHPQPQEEPTRRQTRAPVPNFERISLSPRSTSTAHRVDSHSSKPTVLEQIHRPRTDPQTQIRSINPEQIHRYRNQSPSGPDIQTTHRSHSEVLNQAREENFAKSTIHIGDLSQIQGVPGPWEWI
jgi:hypothetical protein